MTQKFRNPYVAIVVLLSPVVFRLATWESRVPHGVDLAAAAQGKELFEHEWTAGDPLAGNGDGLGPVFNASSCAACHRRGGVGGSGGLENNVTTFTIRPVAPGQASRQGVVHAQAISDLFQESLTNVHPLLPQALPFPLAVRPATDSSMAGCDISTLRFPPGVHVSQRKTPALFGAKLIDDLPDHVIIAQERLQRLKSGLAPSTVETAPVGRALRTAQGRVGRFGWKGQTDSVLHFVQAACANELGLGNPGQAQPRPLGQPDYQPPALDLTDEQCRQLTAFIDGLPRPVERLPDAADSREQAAAGKQLFAKIGCADCHVPDLGNVQGLYSDLLLHRMGAVLEGGGSYNDPPIEVPDFEPGSGPQPSEWRTPPLWGVANSAPYMHDGRAASLQDAIGLHGGQGAAAAQRFHRASIDEKMQLVTFLQTLQTPLIGD
jgi:CxxC motif-containing protein (DUF1111 family)